MPWLATSFQASNRLLADQGYEGRPGAARWRRRRTDPPASRGYVGAWPPLPRVQGCLAQQLRFAAPASVAAARAALWAQGALPGIRAWLVVRPHPANRIRARREQRPVDRPESEEGIGSEQAAPAASVGVRPLDDSTPTSTATELYVFMKQAPYTRLRHGPCGSRDLF